MSAGHLPHRGAFLVLLGVPLWLGLFALVLLGLFMMPALMCALVVLGYFPVRYVRRTRK